ncbi:MAG: hypothetical protein H6Q59_2994 [Firmicutes bacterium]|nr:hypothetical protein [Bacillota bacterium]
MNNEFDNKESMNYESQNNESQNRENMSNETRNSNESPSGTPYQTTNTEANGTQYNQYMNQSSNPNNSYSNIGYEQGYATNTVNNFTGNGKGKLKKKRGFGKVMGLTAAAVAFGLIAGIAFQGYYMIAWPDASKIGSSNNNNKLAIAEVTQNTGSKDTIKPTSNTSDSVVTDVSDVVEKVMPSIVAINSKATVTTQDFFGREYDQQSEGSGSGIIIGQNGSELLIVTNNHVINGATEIEIVFADGSKASATVKGSDANADLAVLTVDSNSLSKETASTIKSATLGDSNAMVPGEMVIAIGNALGYGQSVTVGYVSAVNREVTIDNQTMTLLQTDAAINPGNSGGALLNTAGEVIGINSVKFASQEVEGMGYAIPISNALPMINELMNREVIAVKDQGFLGIDSSTAQEVTDIYSQRFNMPIGIYVNGVVKDSPAEKAGLMQGDIITGLDGSKIEKIDDLKNALSYKKAGQTVDLTIQVLDGGSYVEKVLKITLGEKQQ